MLISKFENNSVETRINELERQNNIILPSQYRNFLCKYNGGDTPNTTYKAGRSSSALRGFYGFGDVRYSLDSLTNLQEWIDANLFPIAYDSFGNYIAIGINESNYGQIFFVNHEKKFSTTQIGKDFKEFVKKCKSEPIKDLARRSIKEREADLIARGRGHIITDGLRKMWQDEIDKYGNMVQEKLIIED